jgi:integrase/recombinase XerD
MPLSIYRRHAVDCQVHTLGLSAREIRCYRECDCPLWLSGTTDTERYPRQSLGTRDWGVAEARVRAITAEAADAVVHGPTIADCVCRHLVAHADTVSPAVLGHHRLALTRLEDFARSKNKLFMKDLTVDLLEDFKSSAFRKLKSTTRATAVSKLKYFLREAYRRGWTADALAEKVRSVRPVYEQKRPYSEDEVARILEEAERLNGGNGGYASQPHTFRLLLDLMLETGLRVSDAVRYDPRRCTRSDLWVYSFQPTKQKKSSTPRTAEVFLTDLLKTAIDATPWFSRHYPFAYRPFGGATPQEHDVYERMQTIGARCGVEDCRPHRLRDTFAVRMLLRGVALENVSRLLGHSGVAITEKYYAPWIPARQRRLEGLVREALVDAGRNAGGD